MKRHGSNEERRRRVIGGIVNVARLGLRRPVVDGVASVKGRLGVWLSMCGRSGGKYRLLQTAILAFTWVTRRGYCRRMREWRKSQCVELYKVDGAFIRGSSDCDPFHSSRCYPPRFRVPTVHPCCLEVQSSH